jgi:RimJ/RimL family protein N-acetyltransferase
VLAQLETARLLLLPAQLSDAEQTQILFPQWEVVRYLANHVPWPYPPDGALTFLRDIALPAMERGDAWHWTLRLKSEPARMIGFISLMRTPEHNRGFWLAPPWHGPGTDDRGVRRRNRLLVRRAAPAGPAGAQGGRESGIAPYL